MKTDRIIKFSAIAGLFLAVGVTLAYINDRDRPLGQGYKSIDEYGGEFVLNSDKGPVSLKDMQGKVVVLYFGFVSCKEACPISLAKMQKAFNRLSKAESEQTLGVLISIDPERDTPEAIKAHLKKYNPNFIGLTDSKEKIEQVLSEYGVFASKEDLNGESTTYTVDHSSRFYLIDKQGKLVTTMSHSTTPAELVAKIQSLL